MSIDIIMQYEETLLLKKSTELHNQSLCILSAELFRRMNLVQAQHNSMRIRKYTFFQLEHFMEQHGYEHYTLKVGEHFLHWMQENAEPASFDNAEWLVERLSHCCDLSRFWINDFAFSPDYQIQNESLKKYYSMLQEDVRAACLKVKPEKYMNRCIFSLDVYMLDLHIACYSKDVGDAFLDSMKSVVRISEHEFRYSYAKTISRLNQKVAGENTLWRLSEDEYTFKFPEIESALKVAVERFKNVGYKEGTIESLKATARKLDLYMTQHQINTYAESVGQQFADDYEKRFDTSREDYNNYIRPCIAHLTDAFEHNEYNPYHVRTPRVTPPQYKDLLDEYIACCAQRGNAKSTLMDKKLSCNLFLEYLANNSCFSMQTVDRQLVVDACRILPTHYWLEVKHFLQYCFEQGYIHEDLTFFVPTKKQSVKMPPFYTKEERIRLMNAPDRSTTLGKRDYAIMLIIIRLGLRSCDVVHLTKDCIDYQKMRLNFDQYKTGEHLSLALPTDVLAAIDDYLMNGRPSTVSDCIFVSTKAPYVGLKSPAIHDVFSRYLKAAEINVDSRPHGGHAFRASMATSMVNNGMTYEEIRYVLGHKSDTAIRHYTSLDIERLRPCATDPAAPTGAYKNYLNLGKVVAEW